MPEPTVSVVVPVYNGEAFLADCLASVLGQSRPADEVIVVDDQSADGSLEVVRRFPAVRVVRQQHAGVAVARNTGLAAARGHLIAFIDQDDLWTPDKLAVQVPALVSRPDLRFCLAHLQVFLEGDRPPSWLQPASLERPLPGYVTGTLLARAPIFAELGGFDPSCADACDADWFLRARDAGVPFAVLPDVLLKKRTHADNTSSRIDHCQRTMFEAVRRSVVRRRHGDRTRE